MSSLPMPTPSSASQSPARWARGFAIASGAALALASLLLAGVVWLGGNEMNGEFLVGVEATVYLHEHRDLGLPPLTQADFETIMEAHSSDLVHRQDIYGHPIQFRTPGVYSGGEYDLYSLGRDGEPGGWGQDADLLVYQWEVRAFDARHDRDVFSDPSPDNRAPLSPVAWMHGAPGWR